MRRPSIYFSGFASQGDGACFEGWYGYEKQSTRKIRDYAPQDSKLHAIADSLAQLQRRNFYRLRATIRHTGHYCHRYSVSIDVTRDDDASPSMGDIEQLEELLRDLMLWLYKTLEAEHDYLTSDEAIIEALEANAV